MKRGGSWFYRFACWSVVCFFKIFYKLEVHGTETIPKGPCLLAGNHTSFLDPPIIGACCPVEVHLLARSTLFRNFLFGGMIRRLNAHPVDTEGEDIQALRMVLNLLKEGDKVVIFPEGGRSPNGELMPLKLGAAMMALNANVPIVPVAIEGAYSIWRKGMKLPRLSGKLKVTYLPPIYPDQFRSLPKKEAQKSFTEALYQSLLQSLNR
jgi:1-acyl-sn-glycerol-3-phosphate acyltransferase